MVPKYLYHLTSFDNLHSILIDRVITYGKGKQRCGYNEKQISFSDFLSQYLEDFGEICFEFKAENLIAKNKFTPFDYKTEPEHFYLDDEFPSMPFWECEWQSKRVRFEYGDINKIIIFSNNLDLGEVEQVISCLKKLDISHQTKDFSKLPEPTYDFFIKRYLKRLNKNYYEKKDARCQL